jgi:glycerophosphoryl diester phosphodiesterase
MPFVRHGLIVLLATTACLSCSEQSDLRLLAIATLPADTFRDGPTSGQFIDGANGRTPPFENRQPVQGFSALLAAGDFGILALADNGFGSKTNSPDFILSVYRLRPDFKTQYLGPGRMQAELLMELRDPDHRIDFPIIADHDVVPGSDIRVDARVRKERLLTGADFDVESFQRLPDGTFYFGDEFGPFLLHTGSSGVVLEPPISLPGVHSPQNPYLPEHEANLPASGGFEGLALSPDKKTLYPMLEKPIHGQDGLLNIYEFDLETGQFKTGIPFNPPRKYPMDPSAYGAAELVALSDDAFLVIERDDLEGPAAVLKRVYEIRYDRLGPDGVLVKTERLDFLQIADPADVGGQGTGRFRYPFQTIEALAILPDDNWIIINDNNYPFSVGRHAGTGEPDDSELIVVGTVDFGLEP